MSDWNDCKSVLDTYALAENIGGETMSLPNDHQVGMTVREAFAMAAMSGILANVFVVEPVESMSNKGREHQKTRDAIEIATAAVRVADATLAELKRTETP